MYTYLSYVTSFLYLVFAIFRVQCTFFFFHNLYFIFMLHVASPKFSVSCLKLCHNFTFSCRFMFDTNISCTEYNISYSLFHILCFLFDVQMSCFIFT